jgi:transposase
MQVSTVGLDIAKHVFQVHGVDDHGRTVLRRKVSRGQLLKLFAGLDPCLIGMEACATAHHWARELGALGHEVRLMPPAYVKAYVKRHKNDAADAEAICEAVTRPTMRFVPIKSAEAQSLLMLHRARHRLAQGSDLGVQIVFFDDPVRPDPAHQLVFADDSTVSLDQR